MSGLLVSIRDFDEAQTACAHDIAVLDVKDPDLGALGAASPEVLVQLLESRMGAEIPKSFSAGELSDWIGSNAAHEIFESQYSKSLAPFFGHVKIGLANVSGVDDWPKKWERFFTCHFSNYSAVAVSYLDNQMCDAPSPSEIIELAATSDFCDTILFDTFLKNGNLFEHVSENELAELVALGKSHSLRTVVAGSVDHDCIASVLKTDPDLVGVRGSVCKGTRNGVVDSKLIVRMIEAIS